MAKRRWLLAPAILVLAFGCVQIIGVEPGTLRGADGGGGGTSSTSSHSTSTGNTCTAGSCSVAANCPVPLPCLTRSCESGCCTVQYAASGDYCDSISFSMCDGQGDCQCSIMADCPVVDCQDVACKGGLCTYSPSSQSTPCLSGTALCDGDGGCPQ